MANNDERLPHIRVEGFLESEDFTTTRRGGSPPLVDRDPSEHGRRLLSFLQEVETELANRKSVDLPEGGERDNVVYVEFESEPEFRLAFDSLDHGYGYYSLLSTKKKTFVQDDAGAENVVYSALTKVSERGVQELIKKVNAYLPKEEDEPGRNPRHNRLLANISDIRAATLESFWTENENTPFPERSAVVWWEVWTTRKANVNVTDQVQKIHSQFDASNIEVSDRRIEFAEHIVFLVKASAEQLSSSIFFLDCLAELRKPKETADFFLNLNPEDRAEWVEDMKDRLEIGFNDDSVAVCLLDTGVNNRHNLLEDFLPDSQMDTINPDWGTADNSRFGHGTSMAGLALFGDLTEPLGGSDSISVFHHLESVKIIERSAPNNPALYGSITIEAVNRAFLLGPNRRRVFCMAITLDDEMQTGTPSSYSSSIDKVTFGSEGEEKELMIVSAGNLQIADSSLYPSENIVSPVQDPAQAFNALTVGAISEKDRVTEHAYSQLPVLAQRYAMSPYTRTSVAWDSHWAIKPEIVFDGGNMADQNGFAVDPESLMLLTTDSDVRNRILTSFNGTSASTAVASRLAALVMTEYPELWAETVRGIIVHSARWHRNMTDGRELSEYSQNEKHSFLRTYGYGIPSYSRALGSLRNSPTIVMERTIIPYKKEGSSYKTNEMHVFQLPWPKDALQDLFDQEVKVRVTLSYFIEPNPGNRRYTTKFHYQSHGLRFRLCRPGESLNDFRKRINRSARDGDSEEVFNTESENWLLGPALRDKGSIHSDWWTGTAVDLADKNLLAVYPVNGWYRKRTKLEKFASEVRYSLIVSIEAANVDIDLYTPIANQVGIVIQS